MWEWDFRILVGIPAGAGVFRAMRILEVSAGGPAARNRLPADFKWRMTGPPP